MHAVGGILGALLTGVFVSASPGGVGFSEGVTMGKQLYIQTVAVLATIALLIASCGVVHISATMYTQAA